MKKIPLIAFLLFVFISDSFSQDSIMPQYKNVIKFNISPLLFKTFSLQYERNLSSKTSATATLFYRPMSIFNPAGLVSQSSTFRDQTSSIISFTPALRYYLKAKAPYGSFVEFYGRYRRDVSNFNWFSHIKLNAKENIYMVGLLYGIQVVQKGGFSLDFWIVGLGVGLRRYNATSQFYPKPSTPSINEELQELYSKDLSEIYKIRGAANWENDKMNITGSKLALSPRLLGINLGWAF